MAGGACLPLVLQHQHLLLTSCRTCRARCAQESTHAPTTVRAQRCSRPERVVRASAGVNGHSLVPQCLRLAPTETAVPIWLSSLLTGALRPSCLAARASGDRALRRRNRQHFPCPAPPRAPPAAAAPAAAPGQLPPLPTRLAGPRGAAGRLLGGAGPAGPSRLWASATHRAPPALPGGLRSRPANAAASRPRALCSPAPLMSPVGPEAAHALAARTSPSLLPRLTHARCHAATDAVALLQLSQSSSSASGGFCASWACPRSARACMMGGGCWRCSWRCPSSPRWCTAASRSW